MPCINVNRRGQGRCTNLMSFKKLNIQCTICWNTRKMSCNWQFHYWQQNCYLVFDWELSQNIMRCKIQHPTMGKKLKGKSQEAFYLHFQICMTVNYSFRQASMRSLIPQYSYTLLIQAGLTVWLTKNGVLDNVLLFNYYVIKFDKYISIQN